MDAAFYGHTDTVAFLLQLSPVKASIDLISLSQDEPRTALSRACGNNCHPPIMLMLLDAGADPTIPAGPHSPLNRAVQYNRHALAAFLRHTIIEPERTRALHKARSLLNAGAAGLACLQGQAGAALPLLELPPQHQYQGTNKKTKKKHNKKNRLSATAFVTGMSGGLTDTGLCEDMYVKLQEYMLPAWADKGPEV